MISQIELVCKIYKAINNHHKKETGKEITVITRQFNAVVKAANLILDEFLRPHVPATPGMGLKAWLICDDTGLSSKFMARWIQEVKTDEMHFPHDPSDFGRCVGLLQAVPEFRDKLNEMKSAGKEWSALVENWQELEEMHKEAGETNDGGKMYARMKQILQS